MNLRQNEMNKQTRRFTIKNSKVFIYFLILSFTVTGYHTVSAQQNEMMIRISEIEIDSVYLDNYKSILKEEAVASVKLEPGIIAIFPMYQKEAPTQIRILEMYANKTAYELHLKTPHFQKYKTTTLTMVKSLKLIDMGAVDAATMLLMFTKFKNK